MSSYLPIPATLETQTHNINQWYIYKTHTHTQIKYCNRNIYLIYGLILKFEYELITWTCSYGSFFVEDDDLIYIACRQLTNLSGQRIFNLRHIHKYHPSLRVSYI